MWGIRGGGLEEKVREGVRALLSEPTSIVNELQRRTDRIRTAQLFQNLRKLSEKQLSNINWREKSVSGCVGHGARATTLLRAYYMPGAVLNLILTTTPLCRWDNWGQGGWGWNVSEGAGNSSLRFPEARDWTPMHSFHSPCPWAFLHMGDSSWRSIQRPIQDPSALLHLQGFLDFSGKVSVLWDGDPSLSLKRDLTINHLGFSVIVNPIPITLNITLSLYFSLKALRNWKGRGVPIYRVVLCEKCYTEDVGHGIPAISWGFLVHWVTGSDLLVHLLTFKVNSLQVI